MEILIGWKIGASVIKNFLFSAGVVLPLYLLTLQDKCVCCNILAGVLVTLWTGLGFHPVSSACGEIWGRRLSLSLAPRRAVDMCHHKTPGMHQVIGVTQQCWARVILTKAGHFSGASQAQGNMVWVVGNPCDAVGACRGSCHGSHALLVDATAAKKSHVAYRCSHGQVKGKLKHFEGWMVILPPATGRSMPLKDTSLLPLASEGAWLFYLWVFCGDHQLPMTWQWLLAASCDTKGTCPAHCSVFLRAGWHPWGVGLCQEVSLQTCTVGAHRGVRAKQCSHLALCTVTVWSPRGNNTNPSTHSSDWSSHFHLVEETEKRKHVLAVLRWKLF